MFHVCLITAVKSCPNSFQLDFKTNELETKCSFLHRMLAALPSSPESLKMNITFKVREQTFLLLPVFSPSPTQPVQSPPSRSLLLLQPTIMTILNSLSWAHESQFLTFSNCMKQRREKVGGSGKSWREDAVNHAKDYILHISWAISFNPYHELQVRMILHLFPDEKMEVHERLRNLPHSSEPG